MLPIEFRKTIPALDKTTYLNAGAGSPSSNLVLDSMSEKLREHGCDAPINNDMYPSAFGTFDRTRDAIGDFINTVPENVALTQSTADGINRVASSIQWEENDTIVRTDLEHSSGILPWRRLRRNKNINIEVLKTEQGKLDLDTVIDAVTSSRLLCISSTSWNYGTQLPVSSIVDIAHDAGAKVLVDAVQSVGQTPVDVDEWGADFVAAASHKWMVGPWGAGFVYIDENVAPTLKPPHVGYRSIVDPDSHSYEWKSGAQRLEVGTTSPAPYVGLQSAIETLESIDLDVITNHINDLTEKLKSEIPANNLLSPRAYESGLVTIAVENLPQTMERLSTEGIQVRPLQSLGAIRVSVHVFNTESDINSLLSSLKY